MLTSSFAFQQAHLTHTSQENLFRHPPKSPAQKLIRFTATRRVSTAFLIISLLTFLTYFQDHWASPGFGKWQRYSNFHPTQFIWVPALQAFVAIRWLEQTECFMSLSFISMSAQLNVAKHRAPRKRNSRREVLTRIRGSGSTVHFTVAVPGQPRNSVRIHGLWGNWIL